MSPLPSTTKLVSLHQYYSVSHNVAIVLNNLYCDHLSLVAQKGRSSNRLMINEWNKLSAVCVNASSMDMFKKSLIYISEGGYNLEGSLV